MLTGSPVRVVARRGPGFSLDDGPELYAAVVVACAPQHVPPLLAGFPELAATRAAIDGFDYEPIVTCYLQYAQALPMPAPALGFSGGIVQWVFDRGRLGADGKVNAGLLAAVISASGPHQGLDKEALVAKVELPGMGKEDIQVNIADHHLTIKGEKKKEEEIKAESYYRSERSYGSFSRTVELPAEVQVEKAQASFRNGVLEIRLPKSEEAKKKEIKVKVE